MSEPANSAPSSSSEGRQANGQFAKGNQFGPGNPFARKCAAFRAALMDAVTEQDIQDIAVKLRDDAKAGDKAAVKLLFQYVIGKPQPAVDPDTLDLQEMRGYMAAAIPPEALEQMQQAVPLSLLLKIWPFFLFAQEQTNKELCQQQTARREAREQRRQERAQRKAERHQRRADSQQAEQPPLQTAAMGDNAPSANGDNGEHEPANGTRAPSANGDNGSLSLLSRLLRLFPASEQPARQ
jgi:hypothetical protein